MKSIIKYSITTWLLLFLGSTMLLASLPDDFNPSNPPEPNARYKVEVLASQYAYTSGSGKYGEGVNVYIGTSSRNENYQFAYWKKDGVKYTEEQYFYYTMGNRNVVFEAVYEYVPVNPAEPSPMNKFRLYLSADDGSSCSFNRTSGEKVEAGTSVWLCAYLSSGYKFKGWYQGDELISASESFYYNMPAEDVKLMAQVEYNPDSPSDPNGGGQDDVDPGQPTGIDSIQLSSDSYIQIYNLSGELVYKGSTKQVNIPSGLYIIKVGAKAMKVKI